MASKILSPSEVRTKCNDFSKAVGISAINFAINKIYELHPEIKKDSLKAKKIATEWWNDETCDSKSVNARSKSIREINIDIVDGCKVPNSKYKGSIPPQYINKRDYNKLDESIKAKLCNEEEEDEYGNISICCSFPIIDEKCKLCSSVDKKMTEIIKKEVAPSKGRPPSRKESKVKINKDVFSKTDKTDVYIIRKGTGIKGMVVRKHPLGFRLIGKCNISRISIPKDEEYEFCLEDGWDDYPSEISDAAKESLLKNDVTFK